jgi:hypothetical protein
VSLTREQILAARHDRKPQLFDVPEWGGSVYLRVLTAADQIALSDDVTPKDVPLQVLVHAIVDEQGVRVFTDDDVDELAQEDFPVIMRVFAAAAKLNGLSTDELEAAVASFGPAPDAFSSSG